MFPCRQSEEEIIIIIILKMFKKCLLMICKPTTGSENIPLLVSNVHSYSIQHKLFGYGCTLLSALCLEHCVPLLLKSLPLPKCLNNCSGQRFGHMVELKLQMLNLLKAKFGIFQA